MNADEALAWLGAHRADVACEPDGVVVDVPSGWSNERPGHMLRYRAGTGRGTTIVEAIADLESYWVDEERREARIVWAPWTGGPDDPVRITFGYDPVERANAEAQRKPTRSDT